MGARKSDDKSLSEETVQALIEIISGLVPVVAWYFHTHPAEWNIAKRRFARYAYQRSERFAMFWWKEAIGWATYYNELKPL